MASQELETIATRFAESAKRAGVHVDLEAWPEMVPVWNAFGDLVPESDQPLNEIATFRHRFLAPK